MTALRIDRVHALEHTAPVVSDAATRAAGVPAFRVHLHASTPDGVLTGMGEGTLPARLGPAEQRAAWGDLTKACRELTGRDLELSLASDGVDGLLTGLTVSEIARIALTRAVEDLQAQLRGEPAATAEPSYIALLSHLRRHFWSPAPAPITDPMGRAANRYDMEMYHGFSKIGVASQAIQQAAIARGLSTLRVSTKDFRTTDAQGRSIGFALSLSDDSSPVTGVLTEDKQLTRHLLQRAGVVVPPGRSFRFSEDDDAVTYADALGYPVVVKPLTGSGGAGVRTALASPAEVREAIEDVRPAQTGRGRFIVEKHLHGQDYRIYVAYGEVLSVVLRGPASVTGDGQRTVAELMLAKNYLRLHNPHLRSRLIDVQSAGAQLGRQGLTWETVPDEGQTVVLASAANLSQGGDSTEVLAETHPSVLREALAAVDAIPGLNQAGVDMLMADHRLPLAEQSSGICEINTTPALMANQAAMFGQARPVADRLLELTAAAHGLMLGRPADTVQLEVSADGLVDTARFRGWLVAHARRLKVGGRILGIDGRRVTYVLAGPTPRVAMLAAVTYSGRRADHPESVRTVPFADAVPTEFEDVDEC